MSPLIEEDVSSADETEAEEAEADERGDIEASDGLIKTLNTFNIDSEQITSEYFWSNWAIFFGPGEREMMNFFNFTLKQLHLPFLAIFAKKGQRKKC